MTTRLPEDDVRQVDRSVAVDARRGRSRRSRSRALPFVTVASLISRVAPVLTSKTRSPGHVAVPVDDRLGPAAPSMLDAGAGDDVEVALRGVVVDIGPPPSAPPIPSRYVPAGRMMTSRARQGVGLDDRAPQRAVAGDIEQVVSGGRHGEIDRVGGPGRRCRPADRQGNDDRQRGGCTSLAYLSLPSGRSRCASLPVRDHLGEHRPDV